MIYQKLREVINGARPSLNLTPPKNRKLPVMEIFGPTIQGEGSLVGFKTHFVRFGGCPLRCNWCDSMFAVDPQQVKQNKKMMSPDEIVEALGADCIMVTLTGGEPAMWDLTNLTKKLRKANITVVVETSGTLPIPWLHNDDILVLSPKGPSSGMLHKLRWDLLETFVKTQNCVTLKVVVFTVEDFLFAKEVFKKFPYPPARHIISVGTGSPEKYDSGIVREVVAEEILDRYREVVEWFLSDKDECLNNVAILPQLHSLLWGTERGR